VEYDVTVHITPNTDGSFFVTGTTTGRRGGGLNKHDSDRYADATVAYQGYGQGVTLFGEAALAAARERSLDQVMSALRDCREAWYAIQGNVSSRLSVEVLLGRLTGQAA